MVVIFCRVTAELSLDFLVNFPSQFDLHGMLLRICKDQEVNISFQNETFLLHGEWANIERTHTVLASTFAMQSSFYKEDVHTLHQRSRPFSALVEAAEAISRGVEFQDQKDLHSYQQNETISQPSTCPLQECSSQYTDKIICQNASPLEAHVYTEENTSCPTHEEKNCFPHQYSHSLCKEANIVCEQTYESDNKTAETARIVHSKDVPFCKPAEQVNSNTKDEKNDTLNDPESDQFKNQTELHRKPMVKCDVCDKILANMTNLKRHMVRHKAVSYKCEECGNKYKDYKTLKNHLKVHTKDYVKPEFNCEICSKTFCSVYLKECHYKAEHLGMKKSFLCQTCGKSFTTNKALEQHVNAHNGVKTYQCSVCEKSFTYESALSDHSLIHFVAKTYICNYPECKKAFRQRSALKMHEKIHENPNKFECAECGRGFTQKQALQRHIRSHKGLKPFRCKFCNRSFGDAAIIRRHLKLVHKLNKDVNTWREDVVIDYTESAANDKVSTVSDSGQTDESVAESVSTGEENSCSESTETMKPITSLEEVDKQCSNTETEMNTDNIQNVFVTFDIPSQNIVLEDTASNEFSQNSTQIVEVHYETEVETEPGTEGDSLMKSQTEITKYKPEHGTEDLQDSDNEFIEREPIQLLTENLDGTFDTTLDFSKLKRNLELLTKPSSSVDIHDQTTDFIKPDGTEAELPLSSSPESAARLADIETLSDSLGLTVSQFQSCYYNLGHHYPPS